jgi:PAS domain S-box-containing protein
MKSLLFMPIKYLLPILVGSFALIAVSLSYFDARTSLLSSIENQAHRELRDDLFKAQGIVEILLRDERSPEAARYIASFGSDEEHVNMLLTNAGGEILASTDIAKIGRNWRDLPIELSPDSIEGVQKTAGIDVSLSSDHSTLRGYANICDSDDPAHLRATSCGFLFLEEALSGRQQAGLLAARSQVIESAAAILLFTGLLLLIFHFSLTARVRQLLLTTQAFMSGTGEARANLQGSDELAEIGRSIDAMLDRIVSDQTQLQAHHDQLSRINETLEMRVDERTADLKIMSLAVEHSPASVLMTNPQGTIEYVNRKFVEITGFERDEAIGDNPRILQSGLTAKEVYTDLWQTIKSGQEWRGELLNKRKNGELYWESVSILPIFNTDEEIQHFVAIQEDISKRRQEQQEIRESKEAAETANRAKSQFLASMSHELRTPLNAIIGYSELLQEEADALEQGSFSKDLKKICQAGRHLLGLINNILDLSKIEAGKIELIMESFQVAKLIEEVASTVQQLVEKNGNKLEVGSLDGLGQMEADQTKLRQVLINLLSNAAKFTKDGHITLTTGRETVDGREWMTFAVSDTGIGLDEAQMKRIFLEFGQAERSTTNHYGGTGLGLTISRKFCQLMYGDIHVKSSLGEGSTFTARLPAKVRAAPRLTSGEEIEETGVPVGKGPLVLVIDDEVDTRKLLGHWLLRAGFQVVTAEDGPEGLAIARQLKPAAITLDALMPRMGGWEMLRVLKSESGLSAIPIVMCTVVDDMEQGFALGATEYLTKPVDQNRLIQTLYRICPHGEGRVLLVDDSQLDREVIGRELKKAGWQVREAEHGLAALEVLKQDIPDIILLDLMMPKMNGFEFVREIQQNTAWRDIPIVVITAKDMTEEDRLRLKGSVETIISKSSKGVEAAVKEIQKLLRHVDVVAEEETNEL